MRLNVRLKVGVSRKLETVSDRIVVKNYRFYYKLKAHLQKLGRSCVSTDDCNLKRKNPIFSNYQRQQQHQQVSTVDIASLIENARPTMLA